MILGRSAPAAHTARLQALLGPAQGGEVRISPASPRQLGLLARVVAGIGGRLGGGGPPNIFTTLGRHPRLFRAWLSYSAQLMPFGQLPRRDTELVILRVAWRCRSAYEWHQHVPLGLRAGLTPEEIATAAHGPVARSLTARQRALLAVCDELLSDRALTNTTWNVLRHSVSDRETIELCLLIGHYQGLATAIGGLGIEVERAARP